MLCVLRNFRVPDSIFAHYPVYSCDLKFFPSNLLIVDEFLLSEGFMSCVMSCFLRKGGDAKNNCVISPNNAPDCLLNLLPNMVLTACECDVLRDQSIHFLDRVLRADGYQTP